MKSIILRTAARPLVALLLLFSIFLLLRGHNEPGGGFVGGLVAASAFILYSLAFDVTSAWRALRVQPQTFVASGLLLALASAMIAPLLQRPFLAGVWVELTLSQTTLLDLGTPLLFDIGVYLVVLGVTLTIVLTLAEE